MLAVKVPAFDTGGTILDWHSGLVAALGECGRRRGVERAWYEFANEYRCRALRRMVGAVDSAFNIDDVHREVLDGLLAEERIDAFSPEDRRAIIQRWHELETWPDFAAALARLRSRYVCVSFTTLPGLAIVLVVDLTTHPSSRRRWKSIAIAHSLGFTQAVSGSGFRRCRGEITKSY
jgi:2-haloacid dehalogenase